MESCRPIFFTAFWPRAVARCPAPELASLYDGVLLLACAVTVSDRGEMGLMDGKIGMRGMLGAPLAHVARLLFCWRALGTSISLDAWAGGCRGATFSLPEVGDGNMTLSGRPPMMRDFLNHDDFDDNVGVYSDMSFEPRWLRSEGLRRGFLDDDDLGLNGSTASEKNS